MSVPSTCKQLLVLRKGFGEIAALWLWYQELKIFVGKKTNTCIFSTDQ